MYRLYYQIHYVATQRRSSLNYSNTAIESQERIPSLVFYVGDHNALHFRSKGQVDQILTHNGSLADGDCSHW